MFSEIAMHDRDYPLLISVDVDRHNFAMIAFLNLLAHLRLINLIATHKVYLQT
ncbi:hypothetical protein [Microcoleus sp. herbarium12]|uniref:hypothetical protein n=1 Tax=Microcoleus sp. herbarium12 TaxID=3055437 RepID=UPI002FD2EDF1